MMKARERVGIETQGWFCPNCGGFTHSTDPYCPDCGIGCMWGILWFTGDFAIFLNPQD